MTVEIPEIDLTSLFPILVVVGTGLLVLAHDLLTKGRARIRSFVLTITGLFAAGYVNFALWGAGPFESFDGTLVLDRFALFFNALFLMAAVAAVFLTRSDPERDEYWSGEHFVLILFSTAGMMLMAAANDLIVFFLGLETMSVAVYVLAGIRKRDPKSNEAAVKYFILGAFASGFLLYGIALLYGVAGSTEIASLGSAVASRSVRPYPMLLAGISVLLVGLGFKIAAVPLHSWVPDVYEGAPTPVTAFMAVAVKAAAFSGIVRIFLGGLKEFQPDWQLVLWILAALTMTVGNVIAIAQSNVKRMLSYSSIAHAGYVLVAVVAGGDEGGTAVLFYLLAYALMNIGAFSVVLAVGKRGERNEEIRDYAGIGLRHPFLGLAMALSMLSLIGVPPLAGFAGKFYLFASAVEAGLVGLAVIGVLNSALSIVYYLRVVVMMYMEEGGTRPERLWTRPYLFLTILFAAVGTVYLGLFPSRFFDVARAAFRSLRA
jgi:NADH-quinone oxidoreductase subunit N